jgi:hypothetical protein
MAAMPKWVHRKAIRNKVIARRKWHPRLLRKASLLRAVVLKDMVSRYSKHHKVTACLNILREPTRRTKRLLSKPLNHAGRHVVAKS